MILDTFAGPGGWDVGAHIAGLPQPLGMEWDAAACLTRAAAGLSTVRADVAAYPTAPFVGRLIGFISSPPCTLFSQAGSKVARTVVHLLTACMDDLAVGIDSRVATRAAVVASITPNMTAENASRTVPLTAEQLLAHIESTAYVACMVVEPVRWIHDCRPEWFALEQVPSVLPLWRHLLRLTHAWGYRGAAAELNAADYGVPQTRRRAICVGRRVGPPATMPTPTHAEQPQDGLFGSEQPWVTMAQALGWGMNARPAVTVVSGTSPTGAHDPLDGGSGARATLERAREAGDWDDRNVQTRGDSGRAHDGIEPVVRPSRTVTGKTDSWRVPWEARRQSPGLSDSQPNRRLYDPATEPAPTVAFGHDAAGWRWVPDPDGPGGWAYRRPSTTIAGSNPGVVNPHGGGPDVSMSERGYFPWAKDDDDDDVRSAPREPRDRVRTNHKPQGDEYQQRGADGPAPTVTSMTSWWERTKAERRNDQSESGESDADWPLARPATTIAGRGLVPDPGTNANRYNGAAKSRNDGYRVTEDEAAVLQSFPPDYPWQGSRTKRFEQIGNVVPPLLAAHVLVQFRTDPEESIHA